MTAAGRDQNWGGDRRSGAILTASSRSPIVVPSGRDVAPAWEIASPQPSGGDFDFLSYWRILVRHRWVILGIFIAALALGVCITLLTTPIYRAEVTLQIDREAAKVFNVESVEPTEQMIAGEEFFQTQYGLLKSRSLASRVVDNLNLARDNTFLDRMDVDFDEKSVKSGVKADIVQARRKAAIDIFQKNLRVLPVRGSRLVRLTFDSPDAALAQQIVNATADNFIASNLDRRFESSSYARKFLEERLAGVKSKLEESERQVVAYASQQQIINIPSGGEGAQAGPSQSLTASSLVALNGALSSARGERIRAEQRWRQAQSSPSQGLPEVLQSPTIQELTQSRAKAQADYQDKLRVYKPDFPEMLQIKARVDEIDRQIQAETRNIQTSLRTQYEVALAQERSFEGQVSGLKNSVLDLRNRSIQYEILQREVDTNRTLYEGLLQRYKEIGVAGGVSTNNISIVDRAQTPAKPAQPKFLLNILLAAIAGIGAGVLTAFLIELLDESLNSPEDVEAKLNLPLIGSVPKLDAGITPLIALADVRSAFSEAYYSIRTALQFSTPDGVPSSLVITSSRPSEGKSSTSLAIAQNFARLGMRVLLIDGDLRNPSMHRNFSVDSDVGLSNYLIGNATLDEIAKATEIPNLMFAPCGPLPLNPAELLASPRLAALLAEGGAKYDIVVIDGPPVLGLADAPLLASAVGGTLFIIEAGATRRGLVKTALKRLQVGHAHVLGVVLTKFNAKKAAYGADYAYAYSYEYGGRQAVAKS